MPQPNAIPYDLSVENAVRKGIRAGIPMASIVDSIQHMQNAPGSASGVYKKYREAIAEERFKMQEEIGNAVMSKVREGDTKMIEFAARSKAGWNPAVKVEEVDKDEADESSDAITRLAAVLGRDDS